MRSRSRALITATCRASAVDVVFGAQSSGNVGMLGFQQGNALELLKNFGTHSLSDFEATPWSDNFSFNQSENRQRKPPESRPMLFVY